MGSGTSWRTCLAAQSDSPSGQAGWGLMPRNKNGVKDIGLDKQKLNTPGRESFSCNAQPHGKRLTRKRLPTPSTVLAVREAHADDRFAVLAVEWTAAFGYHNSSGDRPVLRYRPDARGRSRGARRRSTAGRIGARTGVRPAGNDQHVAISTSGIASSDSADGNHCCHR